MFFPIGIESPANANQGYGCIVPDIPGCNSAGDTLEHLTVMVQEAIVMIVEQAIIDKQPIPIGTSIADHRDKHPDFPAWMYVYVDLTSIPGVNQRVAITAELRQITYLSDQAGLNPKHN